MTTAVALLGHAGAAGDLQLGDRHGYRCGVGRVSRRRVGVVGVKSLPAGYQPLMSAMRLVAEEV